MILRFWHWLWGVRVPDCKVVPRPSTVGEEHLCYSDYTTRVMCPSVYSPGKMTHLRDDFSCPRCGTVKEGGLEHGRPVNCGACGLHMVVYGNGLTVSGGRG